MFRADGSFFTEWSSAGGQPFDSPSYISIDSKDNIYVAESGLNEQLQDGLIKKLARTGDLLAQWGSLGEGPGQFYGVGGIETDAAGNVFVADAWNCRVQRFGPDGGYMDQLGGCGSLPSNLDFVRGLAVDSSGGVWLVDAGQHAVKKYGGVGTP